MLHLLRLPGDAGIVNWLCRVCFTRFNKEGLSLGNEGIITNQSLYRFLIVGIVLYSACDVGIKYSGPETMDLDLGT